MPDMTEPRRANIDATKIDATKIDPFTRRLLLLNGALNGNVGETAVRRFCGWEYPPEMFTYAVASGSVPLVRYLLHDTNAFQLYCAAAEAENPYSAVDTVYTGILWSIPNRRDIQMAELCDHAFRQYAPPQ